MRSVFLFLLAFFSAAPALAADQSAREFTECADCPVMVGIPGGGFTMGSPTSEAGRFDTEGPTHHVDVKAFALGKYKITSQQFLAFLKDSGYQPEPCDPLLNLSWRALGKGYAASPAGVEPPHWPAVCLDWKDADAYVAWLNKKVQAARPQLAGREGPYRLPSEAEWEYAARGGTNTARWWGEAIGTGNANCNGCGSAYDYRTLSDVDSFAPNPFGLYGVLGDAWEWTADCWHESYVGAPKDGSAWASGDCAKHALRGGSWDNVPVFVRSAARSAGGRNGKDYDYSSLAGFRIARTLP